MKHTRTRTHLIGIITFFGGLAAACGQITNESTVKYTAADSRRTLMTFESAVEFNLPEHYASVADLSKFMNSPSANIARDQVDAQTAHLYAALSTHPRWVDTPGAPHNRPAIQYGTVERIKDTDRALLHYRYKDVVVFKKKVIGDGVETNVKFILPRDPSTIYQAGIPKRGKINYCTDLHYNGEDDHWYFWNPFQDKCPYKDRLNDVAIEVNAHLKALPSESNTYPEYDLLFKDKTLSITYLIGIDENFGRRDFGTKNYQSALKILKDELGFSVVGKSGRYSQTLEQEKDGVITTIDVHLMSQDAKAFIATAADGMRKSDVFIYNGHSGLGGFLSLDRFRDEVSKHFELPKTKYQVFFFNGCSTYSYYNSEFINMKRTAEERQSNPENLQDKSKYLDIITNGIGADFGLGVDQDFTLIRGLIQGKRPSWQKLLKEMYDSAPELSALTMVNGDGDNPNTPGHR